MPPLKALLLSLIFLTACGHLERRASGVGPGDSNASLGAETDRSDDEVLNQKVESSLPYEPDHLDTEPFNENVRRYAARMKNQLMWPLARPKISQNFHEDEGRKAHDGIDLSAPRGTRIYAPADGRVVYAGHKFHGYGRMIVIEHSSKLATIFGHCQKLFVRSGEGVHKGSLIGLVGRTGRATAPHLHFEIRYNRVPVDPLEFLP